jgi:hypothetical protein
LGRPGLGGAVVSAVVIGFEQPLWVSLHLLDDLDPIVK